MKKKIEIIGVMIDEEPNHFSIYLIRDKFEESNYNGTYKLTGSSTQTFGHGLSNYLHFIANVTSVATQFVIVYDSACPNREEHIQKLLTEISAVKKNDCLPTLISINDELQRLIKGSIGQVLTKEADIAVRQQVFKNIINDQFCNAEKEFLAAQSLVNSNVGVFAADTSQNKQIAKESTSECMIL